MVVMAYLLPGRALCASYGVPAQRDSPKERADARSGVLIAEERADARSCAYL